MQYLMAQSLNFRRAIKGLSAVNTCSWKARMAIVIGMVIFKKFQLKKTSQFRPANRLLWLVNVSVPKKVIHTFILTAARLRESMAAALRAATLELCH